MNQVAASPASAPSQRDQPQKLLTLLFVEQRLEHHHDHAENRENNLRQDADIIGTLRQRLRESWGPSRASLSHHPARHSHERA